jgi:TIR domain
VRSKPNGMVFISYAHADRDRIEPIVRRLAAKFNVWWDRDLELGDTWRRTLQDKIDAARALIVFWTANSVKKDFIWSEVQRSKENRGVIVSVILDHQARVPLGFSELQHIHLDSRSGGIDAGMRDLMARVRRLLARPSRQKRTDTTLANTNTPVRQSRRAASRLLALSDQIHSLGSLLIPGHGLTRDLLGSLKQVDRTFRAVSEAIASFLRPAAGRGKVSVKPYLTMERGSLSAAIERNRGHCGRIVEYYGSVGGLRDWLVDHGLEPRKLAAADAAFAELGESDNDLFARLSDIGDVLTEEASAIAGLLLAGNEKAARTRIVKGRRTLLPLERNLRAAQTRMARLLSSMGYAPTSRR